MKKKYTIYCSVTYSQGIEVEAENEQDALEIADEKLDNIEFPNEVNGFELERREIDRESVCEN